MCIYRLHFERLYVISRKFQTWTSLRCNVLSGVNEEKETSNHKDVDDALKRRIFNTFLWKNDPSVSYVRRKYIETKIKKDHLRKAITQTADRPQPLCTALLEDDNIISEPQSACQETTGNMQEDAPHYPYAETMNIGIEPLKRLEGSRAAKAIRQIAAQDLKKKNEKMREWMSHSEFFDDEGQAKLTDSSSAINYGTWDPHQPVSKIPCGGCGAYLHCRDHSIPGYVPKEIFGGRSKKELQSVICQRCLFLKEYNVALDVRVSPEEYPKIISCVKDKRAIAVLMIDMLDFPCSIWPGIMDIIGSQRPVVIVGNKVDLIPGDQLNYLRHLKETLFLYVETMGVAKANIKHVALISAQTGFGVEDLITRLHDLWEFKSDVFLLGCTNVGKSTLFNRLLQSDFCKTQAIDLIQRATTSLWPGTTLNLLKFPILRPEGWRLAARQKRLESEKGVRDQAKFLKKQQLQRNRMYHLPSVVDYVGRTFNDELVGGQEDVYVAKQPRSGRFGINEKDIDYRDGRWCYDTPGVMHPDQILNILTTEELSKVIPRAPIIPQFFNLQVGKSLFLAGLGRIDLVSSSQDKSSRVVVFSSEDLPVTIVSTNEAEEIYGRLLGSELFAVPCGSPLRLADWPGLKAKNELIAIKGSGWKECSADIVLSSAGWVAISGGEDMDMSFRVWTPHARGIHVRLPALLPYAVNFRGPRIDHTPTYHTGNADGKLVPPAKNWL